MGNGRYHAPFLVGGGLAGVAKTGALAEAGTATRPTEGEGTENAACGSVPDVLLRRRHLVALVNTLYSA